MIRYALIEHRDPENAAAIWQVQRAAYRIEADLIDYPDLPPLYETVVDIQQSNERFLAALDDQQIVGVLSYTVDAALIDIYRMVIAPSHFRRGIARGLLAALENLHPDMSLITVSTAQKNQPAVNLYTRSGYDLHRTQTLPDGLVIVHFQKVRKRNEIQESS